MATRGELRTQLRTRLEDTGGTPLWTDADLNDFLGRAMEEYGRWVPAQATTTTAVAAGVSEFAVPAAVSGQAVIRIFDGTDTELRVMNSNGLRPPAQMVYHEQAWRHFGGVIFLQRAVAASEAGTWTLDHLAARTLPAADGTAVSIEAGDEPIVLQLGVWAALYRRHIEDYKRGVAGDAAVVTWAKEEARTMFAARNRRIRGGWLGVA